MAAFDQAFSVVVGEEGGYVNDPNDPGGETKFGISKRSYPDVDIANLTVDDAKEIYKRDFWDKIHGDELPMPLAVFVFDEAVNQGPGTAVRDLQEALGVAQDGVEGPGTLGAAARAGKYQTARYMADRALRYTHSSRFADYGKGWFTRLFQEMLEV